MQIHSCIRACVLVLFALLLTQISTAGELRQRAPLCFVGDGLDPGCEHDVLDDESAEKLPVTPGSIWHSVASAKTRALIAAGDSGDSEPLPPTVPPSGDGFAGHRLIVQADGVMDTPDSYLASPDNGKHTDGKHHGLESTLRVGRSGTWRWAAILEADISAIPEDSTIYAVRLDLHCLTESESPLACWISKMTQPAWSETTCNWRRYAVGSLWLQPGGDASTALRMPWELREYSGEYSLEGDNGLVATAQNALDTENGRLRLIIHLETLGGFGEGFNDFASSEASDPAHRPRFTIDYALPVPETSLAALGPAYRNNGTLQPTAIRFGCPTPSTHPETWESVPPDTMRFAPVLLTGYSDGVKVAGEGENGSSLRPNSASPAYSIATQGTMYANGAVYRRPLGDSTSAWTKCGSSEQFLFVWAFPALDPLGREVWIAIKNDRTVRRSVNLGETWHPMTMPPTFSPEGYYHSWSFAGTSDGYGMLVEYGVTPPETPGRYACHTSDWGNNWMVAIDADARWPSSIPKHFHAVQWLPDAGLFVTDTGDIENTRRIVTLSKDASIITDIVPAPTAMEQPTWFEPIPGSKNEALYGSDNFSGVGLLNVLTGELKQLYIGWPGRPVTSHVFQMWQHDGLFYASQHIGDAIVEGADKNYSEIIAATSPAGPWSVVHRFPPVDRSAARSYAGLSGGKMTLALMDGMDVRHFAMSPVQNELQPAVVVEPSRSNIIQSDLSDLSNWYAFGTGTNKAVIPGGGVHGGDCVEIQTSGAAEACGLTRLNVGALEPGSTYQISVKLWCDHDLTLSIFASLQPQPRAGDFYLLSRNQWTTVKTRLLRAPEAGGTAMFSIWIAPVASEALGPIRVRCDEIMLERAPCTTFVTAQTQRDVTALEFDYWVDSHWTDVFWMAPSFNSWHLMPGYADAMEPERKIYVRSYRTNSATAQIWWQPGRSSHLAAPPTPFNGTVTFTIAEPVLNPAMVGEWVSLETGPGAFAHFKILAVPSPSKLSVSGFGITAPTGAKVVVYTPRFGIDVTNGYQSETREFPYQYLSMNSPVGFAVRLGGADENPDEQFLRVEILNGGRFAQALQAPLFQYPQLANGMLTVRCGELSQPENGMPGRYVFDGMYSDLTDEEVVQALNLEPVP